MKNSITKNTNWRSMFIIGLMMLAPFFAAAQCTVTHTAFTNFNATSNSSATTMWLNVHTKLVSTSLPNNGDYILFTGGTIT